jgi:hypothetical protein
MEVDGQITTTAQEVKLLPTLPRSGTVAHQRHGRFLTGRAGRAVDRGK